MVPAAELDELRLPSPRQTSREPPVAWVGGARVAATAQRGSPGDRRRARRRSRRARTSAGAPGSMSRILGWTRPGGLGSTGRGRCARALRSCGRADDGKVRNESFPRSDPLSPGAGYISNYTDGRRNLPGGDRAGLPPPCHQSRRLSDEGRWAVRGVLQRQRGLPGWTYVRNEGPGVPSRAAQTKLPTLTSTRYRLQTRVFPPPPPRPLQVRLRLALCMSTARTLRAMGPSLAPPCRCT